MTDNTALVARFEILVRGRRRKRLASSHAEPDDDRRQQSGQDRRLEMVGVVVLLDHIIVQDHARRREHQHDYAHIEQDRQAAKNRATNSLPSIRIGIEKSNPKINNPR